MPQSKEGKRYLRSALALAVAGAFAAMHPAWADVPELETNSDGAYINVTAVTLWECPRADPHRNRKHHSH